MFIHCYMWTYVAFAVLHGYDLGAIERWPVPQSQLDGK